VGTHSGILKVFRLGSSIGYFQKGATLIIYFLLGQLTQRLKVGISTHFDKRLDHIRGHSFDDIIVLGIIPGDEQLEREIHTELAEYHTHNEFFDYTDEVKKIVDKYLQR
jgi:hypothetical protein